MENFANLKNEVETYLEKRDKHAQRLNSENGAIWFFITTLACLGVTNSNGFMIMLLLLVIVIFAIKILPSTPKNREDLFSSQEQEIIKKINQLDNSSDKYFFEKNYLIKFDRNFISLYSLKQNILLFISMIFWLICISYFWFKLIYDLF